MYEGHACRVSVQAVRHGVLCVSVRGCVPAHSETDVGCEAESVYGAVGHRWSKRRTRGGRHGVGSYGASSECGESVNTRLL